jgi:hypothetical protein
MAITRSDDKQTEVAMCWHTERNGGELKGKDENEVGRQARSHKRGIQSRQH